MGSLEESSPSFVGSRLVWEAQVLVKVEALEIEFKVEAFEMEFKVVDLLMGLSLKFKDPLLIAFLGCCMDFQNSTYFWSAVEVTDKSLGLAPLSFLNCS